MTHYVVIRFESQKEAEAFAFNQKDLQVEVVPENIYNFGHMYEDVQLVVNEYMDLTDEEKQKVNVDAIVQQLFDYDYSHYNDYIALLVRERLEEIDDE